MQFSPVIEGEWWDSHVQYSKVNRQGLDIITAEFINPEAKSVIILVTGLSESFLKYAELIRSLYERGHFIFTYDHQSQGLSGRF
jgi:alpha-beta hydrolase superfamily lysophospholipase